MLILKLTACAVTDVGIGGCGGRRRETAGLVVVVVWG